MKRGRRGGDTSAAADGRARADPTPSPAAEQTNTPQRAHAGEVGGLRRPIVGGVGNNTGSIVSPFCCTGTGTFDAALKGTAVPVLHII